MKKLVWTMVFMFLISPGMIFSDPPASKTQPPAKKPSSKEAEMEAEVKRLNVRSEIGPEKTQEKSQSIAGSEKDLQSILERAIQAHTPVRAAKERISLAQRRIIAALRGLFPQASLQLQDRYGALSSDHFNSRNYRFILKQPVFHGGILWNTLLQEKAGMEAAQKEYTAVIEELVREVATAYFEYNRASQVVVNQEKAIARMQRYANISKEKFKVEIISEIEHLNVQSLYSQMQYDYETSKQELELAELDLQNYLDLTPSDKVSLKNLYKLDDLLKLASQTDDSPKSGQTYAFEDRPIPPLSNLVDLAYQNRAELHVESAKLDSARLQERIRWGEFMPHADITLEMGKLGEAFDAQSVKPALQNEFRLFLQFSWNLAGNKITYDYENDERAPSITQFLAGAGSRTLRNTVNIGLLDGLADFANVKEAEVARLDQVIALEKAEKEVVQSVKQSYFDYQKARIQLRSTLQRVNYRQRLAALGAHRLEKNEIQISEYLQSEIDLIQELAALHKALADFFTAKVKLNHAIGVRNYFPVEELYGSK